MIWTSFTPPAEAGGYYMGGLRTCGILGLAPLGTVGFLQGLCSEGALLPFAGQACSIERKLPLFRGSSAPAYGAPISYPLICLYRIKHANGVLLLIMLSF